MPDASRAAAKVAYAMAWARAHPDRVKATRKRYYDRHKKELRTRYLAYVKANPEKRRVTIARSVFKCRWKGFTHDDRDALLASQGGRCACCGDPILRRPQLDHCHHTGRIRGVLCTNCNLTLGNAKDDVSRLRAAIAYLNRGASGAA